MSRLVLLGAFLAVLTCLPRTSLAADAFTACPSGTTQIYENELNDGDTLGTEWTSTGSLSDWGEALGSSTNPRTWLGTYGDDELVLTLDTSALSSEPVTQVTILWQLALMGTYDGNDAVGSETWSWNSATDPLASFTTSFTGRTDAGQCYPASAPCDSDDETDFEDVDDVVGPNGEVNTLYSPAQAGQYSAVYDMSAVLNVPGSGSASIKWFGNDWTDAADGGAPGDYPHDEWWGIDNVRVCAGVADEEETDDDDPIVVNSSLRQILPLAIGVMLGLMVTALIAMMWRDRSAKRTMSERREKKSGSSRHHHHHHGRVGHK